MFTVVSVLIVAACVFLTLIVLVQNSKGGGLAANFSSSNQVLGVRKTADFLEKATWTLAGILVLLCVIAALSIPRTEMNSNKSILDAQIENAADPSTVPAFPAAGAPVESNVEQPATEQPAAVEQPAAAETPAAE